MEKEYSKQKNKTNEKKNVQNSTGEREQRTSEAAHVAAGSRERKGMTRKADGHASGLGPKGAVCQCRGFVL